MTFGKMSGSPSAGFHLARPAVEKDTENHLIPMINIVFLLLIFFMLAGAIRSTDAFPVDPPESRQPEFPVTDGIMLLLGADGRLAIDNDILSASEWGKLAERLLPDGIAADTPLPALWIQADQHTPALLLVDLLERLRTFGVSQVHLLTLGPSSPAIPAAALPDPTRNDAGR